MDTQPSLFDQPQGTVVTVSPDWWVLNDGHAGEALSRMAGKGPQHPEKVKVFIDHDTPCGSVESALRQKELIGFAEKYGCELFNGRGIAHQIMLDRFVRPGDVVAGCFAFPAMYGAGNAFALAMTPEELAVSLQDGKATVAVPRSVTLRLEGALTAHTSAKDLALTLRADSQYELSGARVVFTGPGAEALSPSERTTLCQMSGAASASFGGGENPAFTLDLASIAPVVAGPHEPTLLHPVTALSGTMVNEVFIGGCSGGRIDDLRQAAAILKGRRVPPRVRLMVAPATTDVYRQAADEGLLETIMNAGAILMNQGCSVCWGVSQGIVEDGEVLLSAGSRNHKGCAGSEGANVYLCSTATAAHSALAGSICGGNN